MRTPAPARTLMLCAALTVLALTGCSDDGPSDAQISASWASQAAEHAAEEEAEAIQEAEQAIRDYWHARALCLADPRNTDPSCFDEVSYGDQLAQDRSDLKDAQDYGVHYTGEATYVRTERVVSVDLSTGPDKEVRLSGCISIEDYDIILPDGTSFIPPDEPRRTRSIFVVLKHTSEWQVADTLDDPEGEAC